MKSTPRDRKAHSAASPQPGRSGPMPLADVLGYMADHPEEFSKAEMAGKMREAAGRILSDGEALARARKEVRLAIESLDRVRAATILAERKPAGRA